MAQTKKITDLDYAQQVTSADEFVVIDTSLVNSGTDSGNKGKTTRATLGQIQEGLFPNGLPEGDKGEPGASVKGEPGDFVKGTKGQQGGTGPAPTITYNASTKTLFIST